MLRVDVFAKAGKFHLVPVYVHHRVRRLPMVTKTAERAYVQFRRFLLNDSYDMIQWSVYARLLNGNDDHEKHLKRLIDSLSPAGSIRCMTVTEKQFAGIRLLVGMPLFQEKKVPAQLGRAGNWGGQIVVFRGVGGIYNKVSYACQARAGRPVPGLAGCSGNCCN